MQSRSRRRRGAELLQFAGFRVLFVESLFYFPRSLGWFRPLENVLAKLPLGGQYLAFCIKDTTS